MTAYPFVPGLDYGDRQGTLGIVVHMTEGADAGAVHYLERHRGESRDEWIARVRGVSAHFVILSTGDVTQMVAWGHASGSLKPGLQGPAVGFYRQAITEAVLGDHWRDPNAWTISVELAGYASTGPTGRQVDALARIFSEARERYPSIVGAIGHHDQTTWKACPGTSIAMRAAWSRLGHGVWDMAVETFPTVEATDTEAQIKTDAWTYAWSDFRADDRNVQIRPGRTFPYIGKPGGVDAIAYDVDPAKPGRSARFVKPGDIVALTHVPPPAPAPAEYPVVVTIGTAKVTGKVTLP